MRAFGRIGIILGSVLLANAVSPGRAQGDDCRAWEFEGSINPPERSGIKLGMELTSVGHTYKRYEKAPGTRYFDTLKANTYVTNGGAIEAVLCDDGRELVVGVQNSTGFAIRQRPMAGWSAAQRSDLTRSGVRDVEETNEGQDKYLWGVKTRVPAHAGGTADYLVLRRWCRMTVDKGARMCGLSGSHVHWLRSKQLSR